MSHIPVGLLDGLDDELARHNMHLTAAETPLAGPCLGGGVAFNADSRCPDLRYDARGDEGNICDLVLISKVQLD